MARRPVISLAMVAGVLLVLGCPTTPTTPAASVKPKTSTKASVKPVASPTPKPKDQSDVATLPTPSPTATSTATPHQFASWVLFCSDFSMSRLSVRPCCFIHSTI